MSKVIEAVQRYRKVEDVTSARDDAAPGGMGGAWRMLMCAGLSGVGVGFLPGGGWAF